MPTVAKPAVPATPRVISPSPTPSERETLSRESSYFGPTTRAAAARRRQLATPQPLEEGANKERESEEEGQGPSARRTARTRSRSPLAAKKLNGLTPVSADRGTAAAKPAATNGKPTKQHDHQASTTNGHLSPNTAQLSGWSWRDFSRSPSPLGLIPIHRHWRTFVHKHEVPRKLLHTSIGFLVIWLYASGTQTSSVCPWLMGALIPIATVDYIRHANASFNRFYVKVMGAFMRESEVSGWNGVIFYLLGAWIVLYSFPKDVGVMGVLLLSWCDTAASTFGRMYGRYTPRIRSGKSLAGSSAAFLTGFVTAWSFWGWLVPAMGPLPGNEAFMFKGSLSLPLAVSAVIGLAPSQATVSGGLALALVSAWSGFAAAASEVVDIFGWDDNLTIPVLSGLGIWGFLKVFG
ncbi:hypothetical protein BD289DRAFT_409275 [Coniella lustricola]|uniref:Cytidylyltransferase family-domain-containing protein n=1 Tax=Coniella lustricola TaxID=2025994 RepID=A0A2T3A872_9PEZI|nr:hypothetical protein BD289DRAFT_409275 [Coniella lustricola]